LATDLFYRNEAPIDFVAYLTFAEIGRLGDLRNGADGPIQDRFLHHGALKAPEKTGSLLTITFPAESSHDQREPPNYARFGGRQWTNIQRKIGAKMS
jgi:hypothetical protein